jgi:hypothetical protein
VTPAPDEVYRLVIDGEDFTLTTVRGGGTGSA